MNRKVYLLKTEGQARASTKANMATAQLLLQDLLISEENLDLLSQDQEKRTLLEPKPEPSMEFLSQDNEKRTRAKAKPKAKAKAESPLSKVDEQKLSTRPFSEVLNEDTLDGLQDNALAYSKNSDFESSESQSLLKTQGQARASLKPNMLTTQLLFQDMLITEENLDLLRQDAEKRTLLSESPLMAVGMQAQATSTPNVVKPKQILFQDLLKHRKGGKGWRRRSSAGPVANGWNAPSSRRATIMVIICTHLPLSIGIYILKDPRALKKGMLFSFQRRPSA